MTDWNIVGPKLYAVARAARDTLDDIPEELRIPGIIKQGRILHRAWRGSEVRPACLTAQLQKPPPYGVMMRISASLCKASSGADRRDVVGSDPVNRMARPPGHSEPDNLLPRVEPVGSPTH